MMTALAALGEACRRMAVQHYLQADHDRAIAGQLARAGHPWASELAYSDAAEAEGLADVYAWFASLCLFGHACDCPSTRPCGCLQGRYLLKLPRVVMAEDLVRPWSDQYLTTDPGPEIEIPAHVPELPARQTGADVFLSTAPIRGVALCDDRAASCRCREPAGHAPPHRCDPRCGGAWEWADGLISPVEWPSGVVVPGLGADEEW